MSRPIVGDRIGEVDLVPMRRNRERADFSLGSVHYRARIAPSETRIERPRALIAGDDSEPGASMASAADFAFGLVKKRRRHTSAAGRSTDVDLLHFVALHDDKSHDPIARLRHPHAFEPFPRPGYKLLLVAMTNELRWNMSDVTVGSPDVPAPGNCVDIMGACPTDDVRLGTCGLVCIH